MDPIWSKFGGMTSYNPWIRHFKFLAKMLYSHTMWPQVPLIYRANAHRFGSYLPFPVFFCLPISYAHHPRGMLLFISAHMQMINALWARDFDPLCPHAFFVPNDPNQTWKDGSQKSKVPKVLISSQKVPLVRLKCHWLFPPDLWHCLLIFCFLPTGANVVHCLFRIYP